MFLKKLILLLLLTTPILIFQACSDTPTDAGSGLLDQDKVDVLTYNTASDSAEVTASYRKRTLNLGTAVRLLIGRSANIEAGTLMRFNFVLEDTLVTLINNNSVTVESANLTLTRNYRFDASGNQFDIYAYKVNSPWLSTTFNSDSLSTLQYDNVDQKTEISAGDTITMIGLQPQLVLSWLKAAADTAASDDYGVYLKATEGTLMVSGYYDVTSSDGVSPKLNVVLKSSSGELDTLQYGAFADVSVVTGVIPQVSANTIILRSSLEIVSDLRFDISALPQSAIINRAVLTLSKNTAETLTGDDYTNSLSAYFRPDSTKPDSVTSVVTLSAGDNHTYSGDVTSYVQQWVTTGNNAGLLITPTGRYAGVELFALYGPGAETALKPRLTITYTTKQ